MIYFFTINSFRDGLSVTIQFNILPQNLFKIFFKNFNSVIILFNILIPQITRFNELIKQFLHLSLQLRLITIRKQVVLKEHDTKCNIYQ